jgi:hypothetical protein
MTTPESMPAVPAPEGYRGLDENRASATAEAPTSSSAGESRMKDRLTQTRHQVAEQTRRAAADARSRIAVGVRSATKSGMTSVCKGCHDVSDALRDASNTLREREDSRAAAYVTGAADGLERASRYLEGRTPDQIAGEAGDIVRRHPALVLGGLLVAGLLVGRFLRASAPAATRVGSDEQPEPMGAAPSSDDEWDRI